MALTAIGRPALILARLNAPAKVARAQGRTVYAFTRPGDLATQTFAQSLGAE